MFLAANKLNKIHFLFPLVYCVHEPWCANRAMLSWKFICQETGKCCAWVSQEEKEYIFHLSSGIALTRTASLLISPDLQLDQGVEKT